MNYPQIKPTLNLDFSNTKTLDPRINFRRGTPGAYYDGKTYAKAEENLIDYSEDFSQWGYGRIVQTSGQSAPDGSSGAYKIEQASGETVSGYAVRQIDNISGEKVYTFSVYAKAGTNRNYLVLRTRMWTPLPGDIEFTYFDLVNGVVANADEKHSASISDAGNGWYRCSITHSTESISTLKIEYAIYFSDNSYSADGSSVDVTDDGGFIYLWGAQLEQRDSVTAYTPTSGTPITKYQPQLMFASPDQPRFDYDPLTGESKGLLIEESRTNLIAHSQQIEAQSEDGADNNVWVVSGTASNALLDLNASTAPDGTFSASKIYADIPSKGCTIYQQVYTTDTTPETLTFSVFAKAGQANRYLQLFTGSGDVDGNPFVNFNLFAGTISRDDDSIGSIVDIGNGWYRCIITFTTTSTSGARINPVICLIDDENAARAPSWAGDGYSGIYIWGAQLEEASFPTSYIKTSGASATRSADNASITGENFSSWYRQDEGSFYIESGTAVEENYTPYLGVGLDGDGDDYKFDSIMSINNQIFFNNWNEVLLTGGLKINENGTSEKIAAVYKDDDFAISANGSDVVSDTDGLHYKGMKTLYIGQTPYSVTNRYLGNCIKKLSYYPQRLTNEQLQQLTK